MPTKSYGRFLNNLETVTRLENEYSCAKDRRHSKGKGAFDHITRSAVVFLVSSFEVYCEEVINECCNVMISYAKDAVNLPHLVKKTLSDHVRNEKNGVPPIDLCDEGWRGVYRMIVKQETERLNTPNLRKLKDLFQKLIGIESTQWDLIPDITTLDDIIVFRGEITHRVRAATYVRIEKVAEYKEYIGSLVIAIERMLRDFIMANYSSKVPWNDTYDRKK